MILKRMLIKWFWRAWSAFIRDGIGILICYFEVCNAYSDFHTKGGGDFLTFHYFLMTDFNRTVLGWDNYFVSRLVGWLVGYLLAASVIEFIFAFIHTSSKKLKRNSYVNLNHKLKITFIKIIRRTVIHKIDQIPYKDGLTYKIEN
jgi:hypothetical protein